MLGLDSCSHRDGGSVQSPMTYSGSGLDPLGYVARGGDVGKVGSWRDRPQRGGGGVGGGDGGGGRGDGGDGKDVSEDCCCWGCYWMRSRMVMVVYCCWKTKLRKRKRIRKRRR